MMFPGQFFNREIKDYNFFRPNPDDDFTPTLVLFALCPVNVSLVKFWKLSSKTIVASVQYRLIGVLRNF